jgi:dTDP-4-dehydrorhamnose 3,5-epimerase-like enzyme
MADLVTVTPLLYNADNRGELAELLREDDSDFSRFGQVYAVRSYKAGTIRGLHSHEKLEDWFVVVRGAAHFRFFDDEGNEQSVVASERKLVRIHIPAGVIHGWCALEDDTILISIASEPYCGIGRNGPKDEKRIPHDTFDDGYDGWEVLPR